MQLYRVAPCFDGATRVAARYHCYRVSTEAKGRPAGGTLVGSAAARRTATTNDPFLARLLRSQPRQHVAPYMAFGRDWESDALPSATNPGVHP